MKQVLAVSAKKAGGHYFYGSTPETLQVAQQKDEERYPGVVISGMMSPPFREMTPQEDAQAVAEINATKPDFVWVGLGGPKQERWMAAHEGSRTSLDDLALVRRLTMRRATLSVRPCGCRSTTWNGFTDYAGPEAPVPPLPENKCKISFVDLAQRRITGKDKTIAKIPCCTLEGGTGPGSLPDVRHFLWLWGCRPTI